MSKINIIPIFIPHLGCPNDCVFCNQKKITGISTLLTGGEIEEKIVEYLGYFKPGREIEIAFYGGSFTALTVEKQLEFLAIGKKYKDLELVDKIRLSTRPDFIDDAILDRLEEYGVDIIELGVQSLSNSVLELSNRGHDAKSVYDAVKCIKQRDFTLGLQQMIGLPGDNYETSLYTTRELISLKPDFVRIYPTLIVVETELENMYRDGLYSPLTVETAVDYVTDYFILFTLNKIPVIRVGLQNTESISLDGDVVAGPFHEAFGELVKSEIFRRIIVWELKDTELKDLNIVSSQKTISLIVGQKSTNRDAIVRDLGLDDISFKPIIDAEDYLYLEYNGLSQKIIMSDSMEKYARETGLR